MAEDKLDELAAQLDDAMITVEELQEQPGHNESGQVERLKDALEKARDAVDEIASSDD